MVNKKSKNRYDIPIVSIILFCLSFVILLLTLSPYFSPINKRNLFPAKPTPTPEKPYTYSCPDTEWVNCMPGPGPRKEECGQDYLNWATDNCPDFKGAAL